MQRNLFTLLTTSLKKTKFHKIPCFDAGGQSTEHWKLIFLRLPFVKKYNFFHYFWQKFLHNLGPVVEIPNDQTSGLDSDQILTILGEFGVSNNGSQHWVCYLVFYLNEKKKTFHDKYRDFSTWPVSVSQTHTQFLHLVRAVLLSCFDINISSIARSCLSIE